ncbi:3-hydroxyisobutyryl-CoA hydrolase 1-like, partial [Trifolium medium]|nr:3-hydroxyisobutyryl-CoA hydrolase 1-like [Trifolium medium]
EYVGLTGARLDAAEMLACGLATHYVPSSAWDLKVYHEMCMDKYSEVRDAFHVSQ